MITPSAFGLFLRDKQIQAGLTQGQLAEAVGKTSHYIHNIGKRHKQCSLKAKQFRQMPGALSLCDEDKQRFLQRRQPAGAPFLRNRLNTSLATAAIQSLYAQGQK